MAPTQADVQRMDTLIHILRLLVHHSNEGNSAKVLDLLAMAYELFDGDAASMPMPAILTMGLAFEHPAVSGVLDTTSDAELDSASDRIAEALKTFSITELLEGYEPNVATH